MPARNQKKPAKQSEKEVGASSGNVNPNMATPASHEAGAVGPAVHHDVESECGDFGELGQAPTTASLARYLKEAMATFQSMLDKAVKSVVESVQKVEKALEFEGMRIDDLEKKNKELEGRLIKMEKAYTAMQQKVAQQEAEVNRAERFSRRNNCRFVGIPEPRGEEEEEDCIGIVENILRTKFKADIKVERAHRDGKKGDRPRHIIFKTLSYREKVLIMKDARQALRDEKYYVTDDLSKRDLEAKRKHAKEVQDLYKKGTKLRFYAGQWRGNGGAAYFGV